MAQIAVIGAGISGVSAAKMLQQKGHKVKVFEKDEKVGGLIKCERVQDNLFHKVGGHVFNTKDQKVSDWFWSFFDKESEFVKARRNAKILMDERYIGYPLENYLYQLQPETVKSIIQDLIQIAASRENNFSSFEEFLKGNFGNTLYELYFKPYNHKIWNADLSQVPLEWLDGKLPMPDFSQIIFNNIIKKEESEMVHSSFFYAKDGGSQFIIDRLAEGLEIVTCYNLQSLERKGEKVVLNDFDVFDQMIFTGDVRSLEKMYRGKDATLTESLRSVTNLRANGTSNLFCETDNNDLSWLYIPESKFKAHRIIYTGNFSDSNNRGSSRKTCVVEFSGKCDYDTMCEEIKNLPGNLQPLSYNYEPNSYVIQDKDTRLKIEKIKSQLKGKGIYILGRFGEWEYYNMDKAIEQALNLVEEF